MEFKSLEQPLLMKGKAESILGPFMLSIEEAWRRLSDQNKWKGKEEVYRSFFIEKQKYSLLDVDPCMLLRPIKRTIPPIVKQLKGLRAFVLTNGPCITRAHVEERLLAGCCVAREGTKIFRFWKDTPYLKDGITKDDRRPDIEYMVEPEDVLWIPSGWWHEVETLTERALLDGFVFEDENVLRNVMRQVRPVYTFLQKGRVYNQDLTILAEQHNIKLSTRSMKRSKSGFSTHDIAAVADALSRTRAKEVGGNKRRDALGRKRRRRIT